MTYICYSIYNENTNIDLLKNLLISAIMSEIEFNIFVIKETVNNVVHNLLKFKINVVIIENINQIKLLKIESNKLVYFDQTTFINNKLILLSFTKILNKK